MERHLLYEMLQTLLSSDAGMLSDGVRFRRGNDCSESDLGLVLDTLIDRFIEENGQHLHVPVRQLAQSVSMRPENYVRALVALSSITLASNHVAERLLAIEEAVLSESGTLVVRVRLGGWLTYQLETVCRQFVSTVGS